MSYLSFKGNTFEANLYRFVEMWECILVHVNIFPMLTYSYVSMYYILSINADCWPSNHWPSKYINTDMNIGNKESKTNVKQTNYTSLYTCVDLKILWNVTKYTSDHDTILWSCSIGGLQCILLYAESVIMTIYAGSMRDLCNKYNNSI